MSGLLAAVARLFRALLRWLRPGRSVRLVPSPDGAAHEWIRTKFGAATGLDDTFVSYPDALTLEERMDRLEAHLPPVLSLEGAMVSLHTAMPVLGLEEESEVRYTGYAPQPFVRGTIKFPECTAGGAVATHLRIFGPGVEPRIAPLDKPLPITSCPPIVPCIPIGELRNADGSFINGEPPPGPTAEELEEAQRWYEEHYGHLSMTDAEIARIPEGGYKPSSEGDGEPIVRHFRD